MFDALHNRIDLDLPRLGRFLLGEVDGEHAILVGGIDLIGIEGVGYGETANEIAITALDPMVALVVAGLIAIWGFTQLG